MSRFSDLEDNDKQENRHINEIPPKIEIAGSHLPVTPDHKTIDPNTGQQKGYIVLSPEERAKGFVRPVRCVYKHNTCGTLTRMSIEIAETYARKPDFYTGTFCMCCRDHFPLDQFVWEDTDEMVGS